MTDDELYDLLRARVADATDPNEAALWAAALRNVAVAIGVRRQNPQPPDEVMTITARM